VENKRGKGIKEEEETPFEFFIWFTFHFCRWFLHACMSSFIAHSAVAYVKSRAFVLS